MLRKPVLTIALLISVALAAGCVGQIPGLPGFGSEVIKPSFTSTTAGVADVVTIEGVQTVPTSPILPEQSLRLFLNIVSHDVEPLKPIQNVAIQLYDASVFKNPDGRLCNAAPNDCPPSQCGTTTPQPCVLQAGETKPITFNLKAPTAQEIANIITRATLSWLVRYDYTSTTNYDVLLVSENEILRLQQLGRTLSVPLQNIQSAGPIKIDVSMPTAFGIVSASGVSPDIFVIFKLRNAGTGFVSTQTGNKIAANALSITIPQALGRLESRQGFTCGSDTEKTICKNNEPIDLFKKESIPLQFKITPGAQSLQGVPHRTFTITANVTYTYELRGSTTLEIKPPQLGG